MKDAFLGVQPIFDRERQVVAYELLFRSGTGGLEGSALDGDSATSQVIVNAFADIGVERLGSDKLLFLNLTEGLLGNDIIRTLPPSRVVLEVLESVQITPDLVEAVRGLAQQGFKVALDDFVYRSDWDPLLEICHIVKLDVLGDDEEQMRAKMESLPRRYRPKLLAEKIEDRIQFVQCLNMGFDLFQGYYLAKPRVIAGKRPPANRLQLLKLLAQLQDDAIGLQQVERIIAQDVTLSYRLLRFLNTAAVSQGRSVQTLMQAIALVGLRTIRHWAALIALGTMDAQKEYSVVRSLTHARFCQIVGERNLPREKDALFTVGLFSNLDEILDIPLAEALKYLPLDDAVKSAILNHEGPLGQVLANAVRFESLEAPAVEPIPGIDGAAVAGYFLEAFAWAQDTRAQLGQA